MVDGALALIGVQATGGEYAASSLTRIFPIQAPDSQRGNSGLFAVSHILGLMGSFADIGARMRLVQSMLDNADLDSGPKDRGQLEAIGPWRTFLCFNDPRIRWSLQREAYAGLLAEGVNFSFRDGGVITAAGVAVDAASQGLRVSTEGIEWGKASGVDLYIAAQRLKIKSWDASKQLEKHARLFELLCWCKNVGPRPEPSVLGRVGGGIGPCVVCRPFLTWRAKIFHEGCGRFDGGAGFTRRQ